MTLGGGEEEGAHNSIKRWGDARRIRSEGRAGVCHAAEKGVPNGFTRTGGRKRLKST